MEERAREGHEQPLALARETPIEKLVREVDGILSQVFAPEEQDGDAVQDGELLCGQRRCGPADMYELISQCGLLSLGFGVQCLGYVIPHKSPFTNTASYILVE